MQFIGSGCWQGIPAPFCDDEISKQVSLSDKDFRFRTSLAIHSTTGKVVVFEMTPDIRLQSWKYKLPKPEAFFVTHWHFDHLFGLLEMEWYAQRYGLIIHSNEITKEWIDQSMGHINTNVNIFTSFDPIQFEEYTITPFPVDHVNKTHGLFVTTSEKSVAYIPDFNGLPEASLRLLEKADAIICDATYLESDLTDDASHFNHEELLKFLNEKFNSKNIILANIGSFAGYNHDALVEKYPQFTFSYDGMTINFTNE
jgi:phosphoribosyl 1,2-cyclic phosphate phosphodiesterase